MATDYDAPRRNETDEMGEDSLEELKARRNEAQSAAVDVDETDRPGYPSDQTTTAIRGRDQAPSLEVMDTWYGYRYAGLRTFVTEALAEACELGETRPDLNPEEAATAIIAVMDGLQIQWLLAPDSVDMAATTNRVITALLAELTDKPV